MISYGLMQTEFLRWLLKKLLGQHVSAPHFRCRQKNISNGKALCLSLILGFCLGKIFGVAGKMIARCNVINSDNGISARNLAISNIDKGMQ
jgi:hypothetical protein